MSRGESAAWQEAYHSKALKRRRETTYARKLRRLGLCDPTPDTRTLDIACGSGEALQTLATAGFAKLYGLDLDTLPTTAPEPFHRTLGDGGCLPFADAAFDQILCLHSLHHFRSLDHIGDLLAEARRVLKPSGALLLIDHFDSFYLRAIFRLLQIRCPLYPAAARHFGDQLRDEREIVAWWLDNWRALFPLIEQNGLKVERFRRGLFFFYLRCTPIS